MCPTFTVWVRERARLIWFAGGFCVLHFVWAWQAYSNSTWIDFVEFHYSNIRWLCNIIVSAFEIKHSYFYGAPTRSSPGPPPRIVRALGSSFIYLPFIILRSIENGVAFTRIESVNAGYPMHKSLGLQRITRFPDYMLTNSKRTDWNRNGMPALIICGAV